MNTSFRNSPWLLLAGLIALGAALTAVAGIALPLIILAIMFTVMAHEFGHYITAKRAGMLVTDFFVGFGPVLWSKQIGETRYGVRALLLGGYVKVPGMTWSDTVDPSIESRTYRQASFPRKVIFASAGSFMHVVMALLLVWSSLLFIGQSSPSHVEITGFATWDGYQQTAAQSAGLQAGDRIVSVNGRRVTSPTMLTALIHSQAGHQLHLVTERNGRKFVLVVTPVDGRTLKSGGAAVATGNVAVGYLGIGVGEQIVPVAIASAIPNGFHIVGSTISSAVMAIGHVFSPSMFASLFHQVASPTAANSVQNQQQRPQSIVGVVRIATQAADAGWAPLLGVLMMVNIFIGVLNMMPLLPLDGGYVAIAVYERLRSRKGRRYQFDLSKLNLLTVGFVGVLLVLFVCTLYLDVAHPMANPFK
jgi:membrane-associated protease RseP (regulator of RpoE activity)